MGWKEGRWWANPPRSLTPAITIKPNSLRKRSSIKKAAKQRFTRLKQLYIVKEQHIYFRNNQCINYEVTKSRNERNKALLKRGKNEENIYKSINKIFTSEAFP